MTSIDLDQAIQEYLRTYRQSRRKTAGRSWYGDARKIARDLARDSGYSYEIACGVIAALSPHALWSANVTMARKFLLSRGEYAVSTKPFRAKARKILDAKPGEVLSFFSAKTAPKTRDFFLAMFSPRQGGAVIDSWMLRVIGLPDKVSHGAYRLTQAAVEAAARILGRSVHSVQATIWLEIRAR